MILENKEQREAFPKGWKKCLEFSLEESFEFLLNHLCNLILDSQRSDLGMRLGHQQSRGMGVGCEREIRTKIL